ERVARDADDTAAGPRHGAQRAGRVAVEPPVELVRGQSLPAPGAFEEAQVILPVARAVRVQRVVGHFVEVPRAALKRRRAWVPATVSLSAIRSHAPERTSSNVRGG